MNLSRAISVLFVLAVAAAMVVILVRSEPTTGDNAYTYDLEPFKKVDPSLVLYREEGSFAVGLTDLRALAVDGKDRVLVAGLSGSQARLLRIPARGGAPESFPLAGQPRCLAVGPDGSIYVGLRDQVLVLDGEGQERDRWAPLGQRAFLTAIAAGRRDVFVADGGNRLVWRFSTAGVLKTIMGRRAPAAGEEGFVVPGPCFDLALDQGGRLWVVDPGRHRVQHRTPEGAVVSHWGRYGFDIEGFSGC